MNDAELEAARRELHAAALHFAFMANAETDQERMVSVIARLEVAAQKFVDAKRK